jgi:hypothetical protein
MKPIIFSLLLVSVIILFCFSSTGKDDCIRERKYTWHDSAHTKIKSEYWLCNGVLDSTYKEIDSKGRIVVDGKYKQGKKMANG